MAKGLIDRSDGVDLAPKVLISVEGTDLNEEVTKYVTSVEVDLSRDMADQIKLSVINPPLEADGIGGLGGRTTGMYAFTDDLMFQPGNIITVKMGYGEDLVHIGSGIIQRWLPKFPSSGLPMLNLKALDQSILMMEGETAQDGKSWEGVGHSEIVEDVVSSYGFDAMIDVIGDAAEPKTIKKPGMSDYQFVKGLANLHGFFFKVQYDPETGTSTASWGEPMFVFPQEVEYTFMYGDGDNSTLLNFEPQFALRGAKSGVKVTYYDEDTLSWEEIPLEEDKETGALKYDGDGAPSGTTPEEITSSIAFRITAGGKSIDVSPNRTFQSPEQAQEWAEKWFRENKDNFITARGTVVGTETLRAGQIHRIEGVGAQLTGDYEMTTVTHVFTSAGYITKFFAHKVLE